MTPTRIQTPASPVQPRDLPAAAPRRRCNNNLGRSTSSRDAEKRCCPKRDPLKPPRRRRLATGSGGGLRGLAKPKTDLVLETLLQLRSEISDLNHKIDNNLLQQSSPSPSQQQHRLYLQPDIAQTPPGPPPFQSPPYISCQSIPRDSPELDVSIPPSHHSATEQFLSWEIFDGAPRLRSRFVSTFLLESQRPAIHPMASDTTTEAVGISAEDWHRLSQGYQQNVNFFYPVMSKQRLSELYPTLCSSSLDGCLASLVVALGDACLYVEQRYKNDNNRAEDGNLSIWTLANSVDGLAAFRHALGLIHMALTDMSVTALLCLLSTALYFTYMQRPLQVNVFLNACAQKCLVMMQYSTSNMSTQEYETVKRIFWSCFIMESDILIELERVPQSGCAEMESQVTLPAKFETHDSSETSDLSTLYFLACISIRRLLNRIHKLLYAKQSAVPDMNLIKELDTQIEEWREVLPPYLRFELADISKPAQNSYQGFLRQRYLAARSVIFRPVFTFVVTMNLRGSRPPGFDDAVKSAGLCIEAVMLHMNNLRGFTHTVVIDTWICSLSMAGVVLVLYIAFQTPPLRQILKEKYGIERVHECVTELQNKLDGFMRSAPEISPSVRQCVDMIGEVRAILWGDVE